MLHNLKKLSDEKLIEASPYDQNAFAEIVNRYEKPLLRYLFRFSNFKKECAEDILQEAFLKMYRNLYSFDPSLKFSSWAYRITHNEAINYLRKRKEAISIDFKPEEGEALIDVLSSEVDLPKEFSKKETSQKIRSALKNLPPDYQEVLVLKYFEDKSYDEISDILKKPSGTIATLLNRAKEQLKTLIIKNNLIHSHELEAF